MPLALSLLAVFVQVGLTFWAIVAMGRARLQAIRTHGIAYGDIEIDTTSYPREVRLMQANAHNQFETPILLYAGVALAAALGEVNWGVAIGAIAYAALRLLHRRVHVTTNHLPTRFKSFLLSLIALAVLWLSLAVGIML
ncbi:MAPEG family protein [Algicella marina]|uniref:MAPEG family protein n=1 Tax=Algicella marina TaxID=2683284 RepID=A0A6P1T0B1_9RHOB|nr:MAPEG family protein [Algicella marina]QHQ34876.1 hypothetical protein GO499_06505 [Algicella marina]